MVWLPDCQKKFEHMFIRFDMIHERERIAGRFHVPQPHIFVSPGDAPGAITLNVVWMEREFDAYK